MKLKEPTDKLLWERIQSTEQRLEPLGHSIVYAFRRLVELTFDQEQ